MKFATAIQSGWFCGLLALWVLCSLSGRAQGCDAYYFPQHVKDVHAATLAVERAQLQHDGDGCPGDASSCRMRAYLVRNDAVLTSVKSGRYICVAFYDGKRQTTGWIERSSLTSREEITGPANFAGEWTRVQGDAAISIQQDGKSLKASASATHTVNPENVRTGEASGVLTVQGRSASFGEAGDRAMVCRVDLRFFQDFLLADDGVSETNNSACGGMGVTLTGIYRRATPGRAGHRGQVRKPVQ